MIKTLNNYNADIEYLQGEFENAERKTSVEEKSIIDSFGDDYEKVINNPKDYIIESGQFYLNAGA